MPPTLPPAIVCAPYLLPLPDGVLLGTVISSWEFQMYPRDGGGCYCGGVCPKDACLLSLWLATVHTMYGVDRHTPYGIGKSGVIGPLVSVEAPLAAYSCAITQIEAITLALAPNSGAYPLTPPPDHRSPTPSQQFLSEQLFLVFLLISFTANDVPRRCLSLPTLMA
jgi:hypothetical protein